MPKRLVALDATWLVHRCAYAVGRLDPAQRERAVAHQVCAWLFTYALLHQARLGFLAFDGPDCFRYRVYPLYKANRINILDDYGNPLSEEARNTLLMNNSRKSILGMRVPDEVTGYIDATRVLAQQLGIPVVHLPHVEADDLLCSAGSLATDGFTKNDLQVILIAKDKDALQALRPNVSQWYPDNDPKKPAHHIRHTDLSSRLAKYVHPDASEWTPQQFQQYQILTGDATDNVPHILKPAAARKILNDHGTLGEYFKTKAGKQFYAANQEFLVRNKELVVMLTGLLKPVKPELQFLLPVNSKAISEVTRRPLASAYADYRGWAKMAQANRSLF